MIKPVIAAASLSVLLASPAMAQVVVDYRDGAVLDMADPAQWSGIADSIGDGGTVLGEVHGAIVQGGQEDVAYLVSDGLPTAADPFPQLNQRIVVFEDGAPLSTWSLDDAAFARPVTAVDVNGDGIDEVILEGSFYNMGTLGIGLSVVELGSETAEIIQTLPDVYVDSCDAGVGEQAITASLVSVSDGQLVAEAETVDCPED